MEQKDKKILLIALVGIFIIILASSVVSGIRKSAARKAGEPKPVSQAEAMDKIVEADISYEPPKSKYASWGRDPFNIGKEASMGSSLKLEGIIWDEAKPFCLINGAALYVGSKYEGHTVIRIEKQKVVVSDGTKETTLRLGGE